MAKSFIESDRERQILALGPLASRALAVSCTQRLQGSFDVWQESVDSKSSLAGVLEELWRLLVGRSMVSASELAKIAERELQDEESPDWSLESGFAQNFVIAVVNACHGFDEDPKICALRVTQQLYEAGDYIAQIVYPDSDLNLRCGEEELLQRPMVQEVLNGIDEDIRFVSERTLDAASLDALRSLSIEGSARLRTYARLI